MTLQTLMAALAAASALLAPAAAMQDAAVPLPTDISAARSQLFDARGLVVYSGDVNVVRGGVRLRADRLEAYFVRSETGARELQRIVAEGDVFYVTDREIARGDAGVYDLAAETIDLTGSVVLTQGCNVSTGEHLHAEIATGIARLDGGDTAQRVRSVFFNDESGDSTADADECPEPVIPGNGPRPFPEDESGAGQ